MFVSHHLSGLIGIPGQEGGGGQRRDAFSCGPYLSANDQGCPENICAPFCPDPRAVAGAEGVEVIFLAVPESSGTKQAYLSLLWACQPTKRNMAGFIGTSWLTYSSFRTQNFFF